MKASALPILAIAALALAGCSNGEDHASPSSSASSPHAAPSSSGDLAPQEQESLAKENVKAAQGDSVTLTAHSDTPATVTYSAGSTDKEEQFRGDWSKKSNPLGMMFGS
ncbi:hypothetical protein [Rothia uropygioeca]|uniref:hypothetical protein n=1 Tax=Kocuria sp. 257 TaxID=2021970 RepID=UPI0010117B59|nr:hypothetical protein [Kocuria sp. 257]